MPAAFWLVREECWQLGELFKPFSASLSAPVLRRCSSCRSNGARRRSADAYKTVGFCKARYGVRVDDPTRYPAFHHDVTFLGRMEEVPAW